MKKITSITALLILSAILIFSISGCTTESDPFGAEPKGSEYNCGPEERYQFDATIDSKEDFVNFIKKNEISQWVILDDFKDLEPEMSYDDIMSAEVDWDSVLDKVKTENVGSRTVYILDYTPLSCSGFTLKMTDDGHVSVYGCCGK